MIETHHVAKLERPLLWLGGTIFVASLAFCAYSYLVTWGRSAAFVDPDEVYFVPGGGDWPLRQIAVNAALFGVFAVHHSVLAREGVKARLARIRQCELRRNPPGFDCLGVVRS